LEEQKSTKFLSQKKHGVGTIRLISFEDGSNVEEHIVEWSPKRLKAGGEDATEDEMAGWHH